MNTVLNYRANLSSNRMNPKTLNEHFAKVLYENEPADAVEFPVEALFGKEEEMAAHTFILTTAKGWNLTLRTQTPDIKAFERVVGRRYGQDVDDVKHVDPFAVDPGAPAAIVQGMHRKDQSTMGASTEQDDVRPERFKA